MKNEACEWNSDEDGNWWTACDNGWCLNDGTPEENGMKFCPFCGRGLTQGTPDVILATSRRKAERRLSDESISH